jgi:hypothetical protein
MTIVAAGSKWVGARGVEPKIESKVRTRTSVLGVGSGPPLHSDVGLLGFGLRA